VEETEKEWEGEKESWCQFHQRFTLLCLEIPKAWKIQLSHKYLFTLSGSESVKAVRRTLMKLSPGVNNSNTRFIFCIDRVWNEHTRTPPSFCPDISMSKIGKNFHARSFSRSKSYNFCERISSLYEYSKKFFDSSKH